MHNYLMIKSHRIFHKRWEGLLRKLESIDPDSLEQHEDILRKLHALHKASSIHIMSKHHQIKDEYQPVLEKLNRSFKQKVDRKFHHLHSRISGLIGDPYKTEDIKHERQNFQEALESFRLLIAFYKRWQGYILNDYSQHLSDLRNALAEKHSTLLTHMTAKKKIQEYKDRLRILDLLSGEINKLYNWYCEEYLNLNGNNKNWHKKDLPDDVSWISVDFLDSGLPTAPLEPFRKVPSRSELEDMKKLFGKVIRFYTKNDMISSKEKSQILDYDSFLRFAEQFSLDSEDPHERLKSALLDQLGTFHRIMNDAHSRVLQKKNHEKKLQLSFVSYFAPIDEIYNILLTGKISSANSIHTKVSGIRKGIIMKLHPRVEHGDIGFIFPVTKVLTKHLFLQIRDGDEEEIHFFNKEDPEKDVEIDIRDGIFIAPKNMRVTYSLKGKKICETSEQYFKRFFYSIADNPPDWFDANRTENWLSRHCIFYDERHRRQILNLLENTDFMSVINRFTNRSLDNLAFVQVPGSLEPSEHCKFYSFEKPENKGSSVHALTLFEWKKED